MSQIMKRKSLKSNLDLHRRDLLILAGAAIIGAGAYLIASALIYQIGFPLDNSWIHQTYAAQSRSSWSMGVSTRTSIRWFDRATVDIYPCAWLLVGSRSVFLDISHRRLTSSGLEF